MVDPSQIKGVISSFFDTTVINTAIAYIGYALLVAIIAGSLYIMYVLLQYKYRVTYPVLHFLNDGVTAQVVGWKSDRARLVNKNGVKKHRFLKLRRSIEPFKREDILPGNRVNLLCVNDDGTYVPMPPVVFQDGFANIEHLSSEERYWGILQLKENAQTYTGEDAQKRAMYLTIATVVLCLIIAGVTVWLSLKAPGRVVESLDRWGSQFLQVAEKMGGSKPPG